MKTRTNKILSFVVALLALAVSITELPRLVVEWRVGNQEWGGMNISDLPSWVGPYSEAEFPWGIGSVSDPKMVKFLEDRIGATVIKTKDVSIHVSQSGKILYCTLLPRDANHLIAFGLLLSAASALLISNAFSSAASSRRENAR